MNGAYRLRKVRLEKLLAWNSFRMKPLLYFRFMLFWRMACEFGFYSEIGRYTGLPAKLLGPLVHLVGFDRF